MATPGRTEDLHAPHPSLARMFGVGSGLASDAATPPRTQGQPVTDHPSFVIETDGLTKRFGNRAAVGDIDLSVLRGPALGGLGQNRARKTSLIRPSQILRHST